MRVKTKALMYLAVVFVTGFLLGFVVNSLTRQYAGASSSLSFSEYHQKPQIVESLKKELQLSDEQSVKLEAILDSSHERFVSLQNDYKPRCKQVVTKTITEIRAILTPEQASRFDQVLEKHFSRNKRR